MEIASWAMRGPDTIFDAKHSRGSIGAKDIRLAEPELSDHAAEYILVYTSRRLADGYREDQARWKQ
jgi:hypothetical protein